MRSWFDPNNKWHALAEAIFWVVGSFIFFRLLQFVVRWYLFGKCTFRAFSYFGLSGRNRNHDSSRDLTVIPPNKKWRISNEAVSLIHSVVSGLWAAYCLLFYKSLIDNLITDRTQIAINLVYVSFGYLLHDFLDLVLNEQSARIIELLFHHVVVITGFVITLVTYKYLGVVIFGLLMELNSVFLHTRSLLNLYGVKKKSTSFRLVALLNIITLAVFRISVSIYLVYWAITQITVIPWVHSIFCVFVIFSLFCSNAVLTYRVMAADGLFGAARARKPPLAPIACASAAIDTGERNDGEAEDEEDEDGLHDVAVQTKDARILVDDVTQTVA
uniref:TLC domain-containing protein n=1 Tax=Haemonchus contortus TaxID=6289 RepID=A0A7I4XWU1_HAECO